LQLRGASFAQDLAKVAGLDTATTLSALWELFWAGLVTPDTFSAVASWGAPTWPPTPPNARHAPAKPGRSSSRRRRGQRRPPLARLPVIGRWSALAEEEGLSPEEREEARAHLLLARYGDRKSTRLNSSHDQTSYAVFCLKKKTSTRAKRS